MQSLRRPSRNVQVFDSGGAVIAGFWQYGTLQWDEFYHHLRTFVVTPEDWTIFQYEPTQEHRGAPCPPGTSIVQEGTYILLSTAGEPIRVGLESPPSPCDPEHLDYIFRDSDSITEYIVRCYLRDNGCLITGMQNESRLEIAHIVPRRYYTDWARKGYQSKITEIEGKVWLGKHKIDTLQNVITLRADLSLTWETFDFCVDPNKNYRVTSFVNGYADIVGLHLRLDHIQDSTLRPLDELFADHFKRCVFKYMRGTGERNPEKDYKDDVRLVDMVEKCLDVAD